MIDDLSDLGDVAQRLAGWLQQRHPEQAAPTVGGLVRSDAGYSNITVLGEIGWRGEEANRAQPVVLRLQTSTPSVFPDCDITRQYRVLQALAGSSVPVPRLLGLETDPAALGAPFFLMERVAGRVPNENPLYHLEGWFHDLASEELRQYWFSGIDTVAAVARVDWRAVSYTHLDVYKRQTTRRRCPRPPSSSGSSRTSCISPSPARPPPN